MPKYDIFISHANANSAWVNGYLRDTLQQAGVNYHTETAFELGKPKIIEFENAMDTARLGGYNSFGGCWWGLE
ncbi:MAG: hypothetical protein VSS75_018750 [Candidatus Parabeggiatoa sp.]|nr:hypothetical protein [Candidatus Parabeggiatoa sp.]